MTGTPIGEAASTTPPAGAAPIEEVDSGEPDFLEANLQLRATVFKKYLDEHYAISSSAIERYRSAATAIQTAAAAVGVLYTGALTLVFGDESGELPARGLLTPAFLALAMVGSLTYLAYLAPRDRVISTAHLPAALEGDGAKDNAYDQLSDFRVEVKRIVRDRLWALRFGVGAIAFAIVFAPAPFTTPQAAPQVEAVAEAEATLPEWPDVPIDQTDVDEARYEAELTETASLRTAAREAAAVVPTEFPSAADVPWLIAGAGAFVTLFFAAYFTYWRYHDAEAALDQRRAQGWKKDG